MEDLDGKQQSSLRRASSLGGKAYTTPQIEGGRGTMEDAAKEKMTLQTILRSGALPVNIETASVSVISPTLGEDFIPSALFAAMVASLGHFKLEAGEVADELCTPLPTGAAGPRARR